VNQIDQKVVASLSVDQDVAGGSLPPLERRTGLGSLNPNYESRLSSEVSQQLSWDAVQRFGVRVKAVDVAYIFGSALMWGHLDYSEPQPFEGFNQELSDRHAREVRD